MSSTSSIELNTTLPFTGTISYNVTRHVYILLHEHRCMFYDIIGLRHGVRQIRTGWSDGPEFVTQCPIRPGGSYTYRFRIQGQEGTLWWHAHSSWLRATVYGALIIRPKPGSSYPFPKPNRETPILLGKSIKQSSNVMTSTTIITSQLSLSHRGMVEIRSCQSREEGNQNRSSS